MRFRSLNWFIPLVMLGAIGWVQADRLTGSVVEICDNGRDDDGNGLIDCFDAACSCIEPCLSDHYFYPCIDSCEIRPDCSQFSAIQKWESNVNVGSYPVLVAGDIDRDGMPEIVTYELETSRIVIINGANGIAERFINAPGILKGGMGPALADLDNDGFAEIIIVTEDRDLVAYHHTGGLYFQSPGVVGYDPGYAYAVVGVADFDQNGVPEIYIGNQIFDNTGQLIVEGGASNAQGVHPERAGSFAFSSSVAVDAIAGNNCTECGGLELVAGNQIYVVDIAARTMNVYRELPGYSDGYTSVADMNMDGRLDAVVQGMRNNSKVVYGWDLTTGNLIGSYSYTSGLNNGASRINIGDLDGDGLLEMCFSAHPDFYALDHDFNEMWTIPIYDASSVTASTIFDFCGDGEAKILYRDEVELRVIDGRTGNVIWSFACPSSTHIENPLVLDVDADDQTDICVVCGPMFSRGRVYALSPAGGNWAKTRSVWNQHGYFNVNINEDLTVPAIQQNPHIVLDSLILNGFMNQYASYDFRAVDLSASSPVIRCESDTLQVEFQVCNEGGLQTYASYNAWLLNRSVLSARPQNILLSRTFNTSIRPDSCLMVRMKVSKDLIRNDSLHIAINANQNALGSIGNAIFPFNRVAECDYLNNTKSVDVSYWLNDNFISEEESGVCPGDDISLIGANGLLYNWYFQDSLLCIQCADVNFLPNRSGWVYLSHNDICGQDSILVTVSPQLTSTINLTLCEGDSILFGRQYLSSAGQYQRLGEANNGCDTLVTLDLEIDEMVSLEQKLEVCQGDSAIFRGQLFGSGEYNFIFPKSTGCDTSFQLTVTEKLIPPVVWSVERNCDDRSYIRLQLEPVDSILAVEVGNNFFLGEDEILADTGRQTLRILFNNGCERTYSIYNRGYPEVRATSYPEICLGDANGVIRAEPAGFISYIEWDGIAYNGNAINEMPSGRYNITVVDTLGCRKDFELVVRQGSKPDAFIEELFIVPYGQSMSLPLFTQGNAPITIEWLPPDDLSCSDCPSPIFSGRQDQEYMIMVRDSAGCMTESRTNVRIDFQKKVFIPNAFTPNGDGINDVFYPEMAPGVRSVLSLNIYSRWGDLLYSMPASGEGWDGSAGGKMCDAGVFVYRCEVEFADGSRSRFAGDVTLIR